MKDNMDFHVCEGCTCFVPKIDDDYLGECALFGPRTVDSKACEYWEAIENAAGSN